MTFSAPSGKVSYDGDGATTAFPTVFKFVVKGHVKAILRDANDQETLWAEGSDYTLAGASNDAGGTLTASVAPASGETLILLLDVPFTQEKSLPLGGAFPSTQVEEALDLAAQASAKLSEVDRRTLKVPESDKITGADLDLPIDSARAGKFLAFDQNGKPTPAAGTTGGLAPVSAYMDTLLPSADAATARATLDAQRDLVTAGLITARGDLIVGNATPVPSRLAKGAANRLLGADGNDVAYFGGTLAKSADYTVVAADHRKLILVDATSDPVTITLLAVASAGDDFEVAVEKVDASGNAVTVDGDGTETINGATTRTLTNQYDVETYRCDGSVWHVSGKAGGGDTFASQLLHVRDEKPNGTAGGTFTSGAWRTRTLNTVLTNEISGASLATNQITLPAGTYWIDADPIAHGVNQHRAKLRNITDTADILIGTAATSNVTNPSSTLSKIAGRFTLAGTKTLEIQHWANTTNATGGFGVAFSAAGVVEIYTNVKIWKVG